MEFHIDVGATMISPAQGSILTGTSQLFQWTAGNGVTQYALSIGTSGVGSQNLLATGWITTTSRNVTGLPTTGATLYVRLTSYLNGVLVYLDYTYTASGTPAPATLISPTQGSTLTGTTQTFTWTTGNGASQYGISIGTTGVGSSNLFSSGWITGTSVTVSGLPSTPTTLYVRLASVVNGVTQNVDYTMTSF